MTSVVQVGTLGHTASTSASSTLTATASGNTIVVQGWGFSGSAITWASGDVTDNKSNTYTLVIGGTDESHANAAIWICASPASGVTSVTLNRSQLTGASVVAYETSSLNGTAVHTANGSTSTASTTVNSGSVNTGSTETLAFAVMTTNAGGTGTISSTGTNWVSDQTLGDNNNFQAGAAAHRITSVASQTGLQESWTVWASASYASVIATFADGAGGGGGFDPSTVPWSCPTVFLDSLNIVGY